MNTDRLIAIYQLLMIMNYIYFTLPKSRFQVLLACVIPFSMLKSDSEIQTRYTCTDRLCVTLLAFRQFNCMCIRLLLRH